MVQKRQDPGATYNGIRGYCAISVNSAFAFGETELVGLAVVETIDPFNTMPMAIKQVVWRVALFYIVSLLALGLV